jgi:ssDNA-binding Zn-finger/Zn-ribbon topoisomerase 1
MVDAIAEGKDTYFNIIDNFFMPFKEECREAQYGEAPDYGIYCSKCNGKMILRHGSYGFYLSCMKYPVCKDTLSVDMVDGIPVVVEKESRNVEGVKCPKCDGGMRINEAGRFGPYLEFNKNYISIKGFDPATISADEALKIVESKKPSNPESPQMWIHPILGKFEGTSYQLWKRYKDQIPKFDQAMLRKISFKKLNMHKDWRLYVKPKPNQFFKY